MDFQQRYQKIPRLTWRRREFALLDRDLKTIYFHLLTTPQGTPLGLICASAESLAAEMRDDPNWYKEQIIKGEAANIWKYDDVNQLIYLCGFWKRPENKPENPKVLISWLKYVSEIPKSELLSECICDLAQECFLWGENFRTVLERVVKELSISCPKGIGKVSDTNPEGIGRVSDTNLEGIGRVSDTSPEGIGKVSDTSPKGIGKVSDTSPEGIGKVSDTSPKGIGKVSDTSPKGIGYTVTVTDTVTVTETVDEITTDTKNEHLSNVPLDACAVENVFSNIFWKTYPLRKRRDKALSAFKKLHPTEAMVRSMLQWILTAKEQSADWKKGTRFVPHASNWLSERRWETETPPCDDENLGAETHHIAKSEEPPLETLENLLPVAPDPPDEWLRAMEIIQESVSTQCFNTWFRPITCQGIKNGVIELAVPTESFQKCLTEKYLPLLLDCTGAKDIEIRQGLYRYF